MYVQASRRFSLPGDGGLITYFEHTRNVSEHPGIPFVVLACVPFRC